MHAVYAEAFGIELPTTTGEFTSLAYSFNGAKEIIYRIDKDKLKEKFKDKSTINDFVKELAKVVQFGDIITWKQKIGGHSMLVYDLDNANIKIMHVNSNNTGQWSNWIKLRDGLNRNVGNEHEGAVYLEDLNSVISSVKTPLYLSVYRPIVAQRDDKGSYY